MRKLVLFCIPPTCGGAERVSLTIAKLLDPLEFDVKVLIIGRSKGEILNFVPERFEVFYIRTRNIWDFTTCKLVRFFKKIHPIIVFSSLMYLNTRVIMAAKIVGGIKTIIRNNNGLQDLRFDNVFLIKKLYPKADELILQTDEMKDEIMNYVKLDEKRVHVIFNPVDVESIDGNLKDVSNPFDSNFVNYVFVGRIHYCKGIDVLLSAFAELIKENKRCRLYIVGKIDESNSYYLKLRGQIQDLQIEDNVIWTGFTTNPYQYIKFADCFVLPSRVEGLPNVLLDAMYLRTPVVATRSVPVIDRIVSAERGIVVDVDDPVELKTAMTKAINLKIDTRFQESSVDELGKLFEI